MDWILYAIAGAVLLGVSMSLYKMPTFKGYSSLHSTFWANIFSLVFCVVAFMVFPPTEPLTTVSVYGLLWGVLFALTMAPQKILLKRMETNTLLPVTSSLGNVFTVAIGIFFFSEHLSSLQLLAAAIILVSVFLFSRKKGGLVLDANSISLGIAIIVASTLSKVVQKIGAVGESIVHFAVYQYIGASLFAFLMVTIFERETIKELTAIKHTWKLSLLCGFFMAASGFAILKALSLGPLSGVYPVLAVYLFVTALISVWLYKESLTRYKLSLLLLTFVGIVLMKLG
jgi:drug/metabolite transporter (DMT)-like permease